MLYIFIIDEKNSAGVSSQAAAVIGREMDPGKQVIEKTASGDCVPQDAESGDHLLPKARFYGRHLAS